MFSWQRQSYRNEKEVFLRREKRAWSHFLSRCLKKHPVIYIRCDWRYITVLDFFPMQSQKLREGCNLPLCHIFSLAMSVKLRENHSLKSVRWALWLNRDSWNPRTYVMCPDINILPVTKLPPQFFHGLFILSPVSFSWLFRWHTFNYPSSSMAQWPKRS